MDTKYRGAQKMQFTELFPGIRNAVEQLIISNFQVLRLPCVRPLLRECTERVVRRVIDVSTFNYGSSEPFFSVDLSQDHGQELILKDIVEEWHDEVCKEHDPDIAKVSYPKVFQFINEQIRCWSSSKRYIITECDLAALVMIMVQVTNVQYKDRKWVSRKDQTKRVFMRWFTTA